MTEIIEKTKINMYVDNERLSAELIAWKAEYVIAVENGVETPRLPPYVGKAILDIARHKATARNYRDYSFIEEMIGDGVENVIKYIKNFKPDAVTKSGKVNAFAYISYIIENAFYFRIQKEARETYNKNKSYELLGDFEHSAEDFGDNNIDLNSVGADIRSKVYEYEEKMVAKKLLKQSKKPEEIKPLFAFMSDEE
jgi:hypothetical protein